MTLSSNLGVFFRLLAADLRNIKQIIANQIINSACYSLSLVAVNAYIMPHLGLPITYGAFLFVGICASVALFEACSNVHKFIADLEGDKIIHYELTLPLPSWMVFVKYALVFGAYAGSVAFLILPAGKLLLWDRFDISQFSLLRFVVAYSVMNLFLGFFALWITTLIKDLDSIDSVWMRVLLPLWFFSATQYPWHVVPKVSQLLAYAHLANPLVYAVEGLRNSILGPQGTLPFWQCMIMMLLFSILMGWWAVVKLQERLDCVR